MCRSYLKNTKAAERLQRSAIFFFSQIRINNTKSTFHLPKFHFLFKEPWLSFDSDDMLILQSCAITLSLRCAAHHLVFIRGNVVILSRRLHSIISDTSSCCNKQQAKATEFQLMVTFCNESCKHCTLGHELAFTPAGWRKTNFKGHLILVLMIYELR